MKVSSADPRTIGSAEQVAAHGTGASLGRRRLIERYTFVIPVLLFVVFAMQVPLAYAIYHSPFQNITMINSFIATAFVNLVAALTYRAFTRTPGTRRFAFILPSFLIPFLLMTVALLGLRLGYNNYMLAFGLAVGVALLYLISALQRPTSGRLIYLVPGERTEEFARELTFLNYKVLRQPQELSGCGDGAVVADLRQELGSAWERGLAHAVINGVPVYNVKQVRESLTGRVQIEALSENSFGALVPSLSYLLLKRMIDLITASLALILLAVPLMGIALAIRLDTQGPALYRHRRVGYRGHEFNTLKFRTMHSRRADDHDLESQKTRDNDARITRVGRFLRRTRFDELPQLINVVRGEMSLIGPRPEALALSRWYDEHLDFYEYRHVVRPGITGWAQVNQGHVTELDDVYIKLQYDFYYIKNVSGWLDLLIALRTLAVMISLRGAR